MNQETIREWLPTDWLDEIVPAMEATPDAYIERDGEGWALRLPEGNPSRSEPGESDWCHDKIEPGQIVGFSYCDHYGTRVLTISSDGTWSVDAPIPENTTHFVGPDHPDFLADSLELLVKGDPDVGDLAPPLALGEHEISVYFWSDDIPHRFEVDGKIGRFKRCAGPN